MRALIFSGCFAGGGGGFSLKDDEFCCLTSGPSLYYLYNPCEAAEVEACSCTNGLVPESKARLEPTFFSQLCCVAHAWNAPLPPFVCCRSHGPAAALSLPGVLPRLFSGRRFGRFAVRAAAPRGGDPRAGGATARAAAGGAEDARGAQGPRRYLRKQRGVLLILRSFPKNCFLVCAGVTICVEGVL